MAIQLTAKKNGMEIAGGYLMVCGVQMQKYSRPVLNEKTGQFDGEPAVQYTARAQLYFSEQDRHDNFGATDFNFAFTFEHVNGADPVAEAYDHVHAAGLDGWTLYDLVDLK